MVPQELTRLRAAALPPREDQLSRRYLTACRLAAAELLLARHPMAGAWAGTARRWMFRTATTPQDAKDRAPYEDGQTVAQWTGRTFTTLGCAA